MITAILCVGFLMGAAAEQPVTISAGEARAAFNPATGELTLSRAGRVYASGPFAAPGRAQAAAAPLPEGSPWGRGMVLKIGPGEDRVVIREGSPLVFIRRDPRSVTPSMPGHRVEALRLRLDLGADLAALKVLGPSGLNDPAKNPGQHVVSAIGEPSTGAGVVVGLVQIAAASGVLFTEVKDGQLTLVLRNDYGSAIPPTLEPFGGDWWAVGYFANACEGLETYAAEFARLGRLTLRPLPAGYCTWYADKHGGASAPAHVAALADYAAANLRPYGFEFVQIDDGWQNGLKKQGPAKDFTQVNPRGAYKDGMKPVAAQIRAAGLMPGLWLLPFAINHQDPVLADRVPLIAKKADGSPFETNWSGTALDLTRPEARAYVRELARRAVEDWGYQYLKLDGLHIGMASRQTYPRLHYVEDQFGDAVLADRTVSNLQAGRAGLKAIREGAGPKTFILGCCVPQNQRSLGMVLGLVDAMRVGPDNGPKWEGVLRGARAVSALYFLNGRVWWNDPDPIYARASVPLNEFVCYGSWVTLLGALHATSDWAPDYPAERLEALRRMLPSHQLPTVRPGDLFEHDPARIWTLHYDVGDQRHTVVGLFNWSNQEAEITAPAARLGLRADADYAAFDYWGNAALKPFRGALTQRLPARTCRILAVRALADHPVVLSTSRHVTQGAVDLVAEKWDAASRTLAGASKLVGKAPYELRILTSGIGARRLQPTAVEVAADDQAAGVTAELAVTDTLVRVSLASPTSRTVRWAVRFAP